MLYSHYSLIFGLEFSAFRAHQGGRSVGSQWSTCTRKAADHFYPCGIRRFGQLPVFNLWWGLVRLECLDHLSKVLHLHAKLFGFHGFVDEVSAWQILELQSISFRARPGSGTPTWDVSATYSGSSYRARQRSTRHGHKNACLGHTMVKAKVQSHIILFAYPAMFRPGSDLRVSTRTRSSSKPLSSWMQWLSLCK